MRGSFSLRPSCNCSVRRAPASFRPRGHALARRGGIGDCARRYDLRLPADEVVGVLHHPGWPAGVGPSVARTLVRARELHLGLLRDFNFKIDAVVALL